MHIVIIILFGASLLQQTHRKAFEQAKEECVGSFAPSLKIVPNKLETGVKHKWFFNPDPNESFLNVLKLMRQDLSPPTGSVI